MANYARLANFGDPLEQDWQKNNLVTVVAPNGQRFTVHKDAAPSFQGLLNDLGGSGYDIKSDGGFNYRNIRGGNTLSQHAFGNAIDINAAENPLGSKTHNFPSNIGERANKYGLEWGGNWQSRPDPMHFEWTGQAVTTVGSPAADGFEMPSSNPVQQQTMIARTTPSGPSQVERSGSDNSAADRIQIAGYDVSKAGISSLLDGLEEATSKAQPQQQPMSVPVLATNDVSPVAANLIQERLRRRSVSGLL